MRRFDELSGNCGDILGASAFAARFGVSHETMTRLEIYEVLLRKWQRVVNLVAPSTLDEIWQRHMADSAQLVALAMQVLPEDLGKTPRIWVDMGSGAGFPGLVAAIILRDISDIRLHLVESNSRKCSFLREVARSSGVAVDIHSSRIEDIGKFFHSEDESVSVISARAMASLSDLLGYVQPFMREKTICLFPKGRKADQEILEARRSFVFSSQSFPSCLADDASILHITNVARTSR